MTIKKTLNTRIFWISCILSFLIVGSIIYNIDDINIIPAIPNNLEDLDDLTSTQLYKMRGYYKCDINVYNPVIVFNPDDESDLKFNDFQNYKDFCKTVKYYWLKNANEENLNIIHEGVDRFKNATQD